VVVAADHGRLLPDSGTVDVRYDRRDPQRIRIGDWQSFYLKAAVLGGGGVALLAIGFWFAARPGAAARRPDLSRRTPVAGWLGASRRGLDRRLRAAER
jgi:hypothetical protein